MGPASENPSTRLKVPHTISQVAKFKCNLLKTSEDIATQTRRVLQRFVWWGGHVRAPHHTNVWKISRLCGPISSLALEVSPLNLVIQLIFRRAFKQCQ